MSTSAVLGRAEGQRLWIQLGRAFGGALVFCVPCLMTQELWALGAKMDPFRLALLCAATFPLVVRLSRFGGLRRTDTIWDDLADALVSFAAATAAAALLLWIFGVLTPELSLRGLIGTVAIQSVPGSLGAILALNQFAQDKNEDRSQERQSYGGELFLMVVGALFLSLNVAPTEEVMIIAFRMSGLQTLALVALSLAVMHGFVYTVEFRGSHGRQTRESFFGLLARYTVVGYVLVLGVSLYVLWTFGHLAGLVAEDVVGTAVVLGFPGAIGAAAARLIL